MPVDRHAKVELVFESVSPHPLVRGQPSAGERWMTGGGFSPAPAGSAVFAAHFAMVPTV